MDVSQNLEIITKIEKDNEWFEEHYENLRKTAVNEFVAIEEGKTIEQDKKLENLIKKLRNKNKNPALVLIRYVYEKGFRVIL